MGRAVHTTPSRSACLRTGPRLILAQKASLAFDLVMAAIENPTMTGSTACCYQVPRLLAHQCKVNNLRNGMIWHDKFG